MNDDANFLSRWSRRKVQARQGTALEEPPAPDGDPVVAVAPAAEPATALPAQSVDAAPPAATAAETRPAPPTLADVQALTRESDFSRFVAPDVDGEVKNAALKKLFTDPRYNVMDGLDTYIDDYSKPDPLPASMLRQMAQAAFLGLVEAEPPTAEATAPASTTPSTAQAPKSAEVAAAESGAATPEPDENTDLRLQPHDAAGCGGAEDGAAADPRRQS
jgi:hypothetical protein